MKQNLFDAIPAHAPEELFTELLSGEGVRIERIVSFGQCSPAGFWYDQSDAEWILLLEGGATIEFKEKPAVELLPGDFIFLPAKCCHRVARTDERTVWLAVFSNSACVTCHLINPNSSHEK